MDAAGRSIASQVPSATSHDRLNIANLLGQHDSPPDGVPFFQNPTTDGVQLLEKLKESEGSDWLQLSNESRKDWLHLR